MGERRLRHVCRIGSSGKRCLPIFIRVVLRPKAQGSVNYLVVVEVADGNRLPIKIKSALNSVIIHRNVSF